MNILIGCAIIWLVDRVVGFLEIKSPWNKIIVGIAMALVIVWLVFGRTIVIA